MNECLFRWTNDKWLLGRDGNEQMFADWPAWEPLGAERRRQLSDQVLAGASWVGLGG